MGKNRNKYKPQSAIQLSQLADDVILIEAAKRTGNSLNTIVKPTSPSPGKVSLNEWKIADLAARNVEYPDLMPLYRVYDNIMIDLDLTSVIETRTLKVQQAKYNIFSKTGEQNDEAKKLLERKWFRDFIAIAMQWISEGFQLAETFNFNAQGELVECTAVNKYHVKPHKGIVTKYDYDQEGTSYLLPPYQQYYIPIGKPGDFGLLRKVAPIILAKKYAIGHWGEYNEKMGIPFRSVTSSSTDVTRQRQLGVIMEQMGSAGWAVLNENEKVELLSIAANDPTRCFETFINMLNAQIAMAFNGQSSTADSSNQKGTYGSLKILNEISEDRHEADLTEIKDLVNDVLIPRLVALSPFYALLKDCYLDWDYSEDLSVSEIVDVVTKLVNTGKYTITGKDLSKKIGIEVQDAAAPEPIKTPEPVKKKSNAVAALYNGCKHGHDFEAAALPTFKSDMLRVAKAIFNGKQMGIVDFALMQKTATYLRKAVTNNYGDQVDENDTQMVEALQKNLNVFSGFKTYQTLKAVNNALLDADGVLREWADFKKEVLQLNNQYNIQYLKAEYNNAVVSAQSSSQWQTIQRTKDVLPLLEFDATNDNRTTPICSSLDGVRLPADDSFWDAYFLPLHFGERSVIRQVASGTVTDLKTVALPELQPMFDNNVGKTGVVFPESHPYYQASKADAKTINKEADKL